MLGSNPPHEPGLGSGSGLGLSVWVFVVFVVLGVWELGLESEVTYTRTNVRTYRWGGGARGARGRVHTYI